MAATKAKEKTARTGKMTPLLLIAAFLSFTEMIAGYTLIKTSGNIQFILTVFVVTFPLLIGTAFFYLLAFRNYVLFAPHEFPAHNGVRKYVGAMRGEKDSDDPYYPAAHSLFGIFDAVKQELPAIISQMDKPPQTTVCAGADLSFYDPSIGAREKATSFVQRITVGSVSRVKAARKYPFLADDYTRLTTQRAIQLLSTTDPNYFFRIRPDGSVHSLVDLNALKAAVTNRGDPIDFDEFMFVQVINMVHGQLIIAYSEVESLAFPSARLTQFIKGTQCVTIPLSQTALVISNQGDIYGLLTDMLCRFKKPMS